jgi:hypothetical protein
MIRIINFRNHGRYGVVNVGRPSSLGNPFKIGTHGNRDEVIDKYRRWLADRLIERDNIRVCDEFERLVNIARHGDLVLGCWCSPKRCHAEVIKSAIEWKIKQTS